MGDLFRANGITAARVYSSQWCRCLDTAALMKLGDVTRQPLLSFTSAAIRITPRQLADLRAWISGLELVQPTLLMTHQLVIATRGPGAARRRRECRGSPRRRRASSPCRDASRPPDQARWRVDQWRDLGRVGLCQIVIPARDDVQTCAGDTLFEMPADGDGADRIGVTP